MKSFMHKVKCFFIAVGVTVQKTWNKITHPVKKAADKVISPEIRPGLRNVGRMFSTVVGIMGRILLVMLLIFLLTGTLIGVFGAIYVSKYLDVDTDIDLAELTLELTSYIKAEDPDNPGEWITIETLSGEQNRIWASFDDFPKALINAVVAIEDKTFWQHDGVNWKRTFGAFYTMFTGGDQFGGSTITQQLIKNVFGRDEITVSRKFEEIFQALALERRYPGQEGKELILELYLNTVYWGEGCYGVVTAAEAYFGKPLSELTVAECAALAGITNNPSVYNPYYNPKNNKKRQENILYEMYDQKYLTRHEYNLAKYQPLTFARGSGDSGGHIRSWYVDQAIRDVTNDLMEAWNWTQQMAEKYIHTGGVSIYLCIDLELQAEMDAIWSNPACWPATPDAEPPEAAMMVIDQSTGEIKAMIGGREKTGNKMWDLSTRAKRQPGSSIKPITVYSPAFELGLITPYSPVDDMPISLSGDRGWPRNSPNYYDAHMNILQGVTTSKNTVSIQTLEKIGYQRSFEFARDRFGLTTLVELKGTSTDIAPSPLAFGGLTDGVTVREMTGAYAAIANHGVRNKTRTYTHITQDGGVTFENLPDPSIAIKTKTAYYMELCLTNAVAGGTGTGAKLTNMPVAGKTGTTSDNKDRWFAGYTPYYTAVCWFGYTIPRDLTGYTGNPAVHMWQQVMQKAHAGLERKEFEQPAGIVTYTYCIDSGLPPSDACYHDPRGNRIATGLLDQDDVPKTKCDVHKTTELCTVSGHLATPYCPRDTGTIKTVALMDLVRWVPVAGFSPRVKDEQYTFRTWQETEPIGAEGMYRILNEGSDGKSPYNTFCELHTSPPVVTDPSPPDQPEVDVTPDATAPPDDTTPPETEVSSADPVPSPSPLWPF